MLLQADPYFRSAPFRSAWQQFLGGIGGGLAGLGGSTGWPGHTSSPAVFLFASANLKLV